MATIFVLEDDPDLLDLYVRALQFRGYEVVQTTSAESAINLLCEGCCSPNVALLDMSMPGLCGTAVVDYIRTRSDFTNLPIIVVSCDEDFRSQLQFSEVMFMTKPINISDLYKAVAQFAA